MARFCSLSRLLPLASLLFVAMAPGVGHCKDTPPSKSEEYSASLNEKGAGLAQSGELEKAATAFRQALEANPANLTAVFNLASVYLNRGEKQQAITLLQKYTAKYQVDAGLFSRLGDAYFSNKDLDQAARAYEKALSLNPASPKAAERLGTIYAMTKKIGKAIDMYLVAAELEPKDGKLLANLSNLFLANGDAEKAISTAKRALQVHASKDVYKTLGAAYESMKDYKNSLIAYQRAQDLGDTSQELADRIRTLSKLSERS